MNSHFRVLVAQKELREKRRIGIRVIVKECGASRTTVERLLNNTIKQVSLDDLASICEWLPCAPGDILRLEPLSDQHSNPIWKLTLDKLIS